MDEQNKLVSLEGLAIFKKKMDIEIDNKLPVFDGVTITKNDDGKYEAKGKVDVTVDTATGSLIF